MLNGILAVVLGLVLSTASLCRMSPSALIIYNVAMHSVWLPLGSEVLGNYFGIAFPRVKDIFQFR